MAARRTRGSWETIRSQLLRAETGDRVVLQRNGGLPHPRDVGAHPTAAWPIGQRTDYLLASAAGGPSLVIQEFDDRWEVALETAHQLGHIASAVHASPRAGLYMGAAVLGGALGASATTRREGALLGAGLGLLLAVLLDDEGCRRR